MTYSYDLFISYCRRDDEDFVRHLYNDLIDHGLKVWWDRECMPSRALTFLQEIRNAIDDSSRLLAVVGPKAVESDYVLQEWIWASQFGNGIVPILRLGDYDLLNEDFASLHCIDFRKDDLYQKALEDLSRILAEPMKPLGMFYGKVPSLPPHFLYRKEDLDNVAKKLLTDIREPTLSKSIQRPFVIHGMVGIGKSVLISAFSRSIETRRAFTDGIFWLTIGQSPDLLNNISTLGMAFNDDLRKYSDLNNAQIQLARDLHDKEVLIVLDDVWEVVQIEPFLNAMGSRCRLLITTRNQGLATTLGAQDHHLDILSDNDAVQFLADWVDLDITSMPTNALDVIQECGNHPFALALAGAMYRGGTPWEDIYQALCQADLQFMEQHFPNYPYSDIFRMITVSVDVLVNSNPVGAKYYNELVVFKPEIIPENAVIVLWTRINELKERDARKLLMQLNQKSLLRLEGRVPNRLVSLHDLQYDFLCLSVKDLTELRKKLLDAYKEKCPEGWHTGLNDGYFFQHIAYLMAKINCWQELVNLLTDLEYIEACCKVGVIYSLIKNYSDILALKDLPNKYKKKLLEFKQFVITQSHILHRYPHLTFQQAFNQPDNSVTSINARDLAHPIKSSMYWFEWINKPQVRDVSVLSFEGHSNVINFMSFSPDATKVITASDDKTLKLWDVNTGKEMGTFIGHCDSVIGCAFSPDGKKVLSASRDKTLKGWDVNNFAEILTFTGHVGAITACAIHPNGIWLLSASMDGTIKLWDIETGAEIRTFVGHSDSITGCVFTPDGQSFLSISRDGTINLWDTETGAEIRTFVGHSDSIIGISVSPDNQWFVTLTEDYSLRLWHLLSRTGAGDEIGRLEGVSDPVLGFAYSPDGKRFVSASDDYSLKLQDLQTGEIKVLSAHTDFVYDCVFSNDGKKFISTSYDGLSLTWDAKTGDILKESRIWRFFGCAISNDGSKLLFISNDKTLKVWDVKTSEIIAIFPALRGLTSIALGGTF